jgi:hypothetical protein
MPFFDYRPPFNILALTIDGYLSEHYLLHPEHLFGIVHHLQLMKLWPMQ